MLNKSKCSKNFKKICSRNVSTTKKEKRAAKDFSKLWTNYSTVKDIINENTRVVNSVKIAIQRKEQDVDELKELDQEREEELERIEQEIKKLEEKIETIQNTESFQSERNNSRQQQLLHHHVLKTCTNTYINDNDIPRLIRGFTASEHLTIPFEIDPGRMTKTEIQNALWDNCYRSSSYANEWSNLFAVAPESDVKK